MKKQYSGMLIPWELHFLLLISPILIFYALVSNNEYKLVLCVVGVLLILLQVSIYRYIKNEYIKKISKFERLALVERNKHEIIKYSGIRMRLIKLISRYTAVFVVIFILYGAAKLFTKPSIIEIYDYAQMVNDRSPVRYIAHKNYIFSNKLTVEINGKLVTYTGDFGSIKKK